MSEKEKKSDQHCQIIRGCLFPASERFTRKNIEDAMDLIPGDGDLIIASYPKTGTTWMQYIALQIRSKAQVFPSFDEATYKTVPYVEMVGTKPVMEQGKSRFYKHHIPYDMVQKNDKSKCIYIYRNPEDTVVSYYHFMKNLDSQISLHFDAFFDNFVIGNISYGSYFQHVLSFYQHREDENLLMVSYEKLHANLEEEILRIARFLGEEHYKNLLHDRQLLDKILDHTSFDYMKKNLTLTHPDITSGVRKKPSEGEPPKVEFFRKGIVGDGKAVLTENQRQRLQTAAEKVLKGTSIIAEWYAQ